MEDTMEKFFQMIYKSCDPDESKLVAVSSLIEFIKPFMPNNLYNLLQLQSELDPFGQDPGVDYDSFQKVMSLWISNLQESNIGNNFSEISEFCFGESSNPDSHHNSNSLDSNSNHLEVRIKELQEQLMKKNHDLDLIKKQLLACEDQNELLLRDLNRISKSQTCGTPRQCSKSESKTSDEKNTKNETSDCRRCKQLGKVVENNEKQRKSLKTQIDLLETENQRLQNKLVALEKSSQQQSKTISDVTAQLDLKELENATFREVLDDLMYQLSEKNELLCFYNKEYEIQKERVQSLEDILLEEQLLRLNSCLDKTVPFNSPRLLSQLKSPVSPTLDTPQQPKFTASKSLKTELDEACGADCEHYDELQRLRGVIKEQELIRLDSRENLKQLFEENDSLMEWNYDNVVTECEQKHMDNEVAKNLTLESNDELLLQSDLDLVPVNQTLVNSNDLTQCKKDCSLLHLEFLFETERAEKIISWEFDSFIEQLKLDEIKFENLTSDEFEDNFEQCKTILLIDITNTSTKYEKKKEALKCLIAQFFTHIRRTRFPCSPPNICPEFLEFPQLESVCKDMLQAAVASGVCHYEKFTLSCWKVLVRHIISVNEENKKLKQNQSTPLTACEKSLQNIVNNNEFKIVKKSPVKRTNPKRMFLICAAFLLFVIFSFMLIIFYVEQHCPKNSKRLCPVQWITNLFVQETYADNLLL